MAGKLTLDWGSESPVQDVDPTKISGTKNPDVKTKGVFGPAKFAKVMVNSANAKVGHALASLAAQSSCPDGKNTPYRCPLYNNGCYAEDPQGGKTIFTTKILNEAADLKSHNSTGSTASPEEVAEDEAEAIRLAVPLWKKLRVNNWFRLHVVGDAVTSKCASIISEAADLCVASSPAGTKNIWNYTHAWRTVPRSSWSSNISVLASCDKIEDLPKAHSKGYACAIVMPKATMEEMGKGQNKEFGNWFMLPNGFKAIPCPYEIGKIVGSPGKQCIDCKYCMREDSLYKNKGVIVFAAHTTKAEKAAKELIDIDVSDMEVVEADVPVSKNPCHSGAGRGSLQNSRYDRSPEAAKWMHVAKTSNSLAQLYKAWEWAGQNNIGGDVWVSGHSDGIIVTIGKRLRAKGKSFDDLMRFEKRNPSSGTLLYITPHKGYADELSAHLWNHHGIRNTILHHARDNNYEVVLVEPKIDYREAKKVVADFMSEKSRMRKWLDDETAKESNPRRRSNPEDTAAEMYETFHGKPSEEILEVGETVHFHGNLAVLGELVEMKIATLTKKDAEISFADSGCVLCSNEHGTQLYVVGGDQTIDLEKLGFTGDKLDKDMITVGVLYELTYQTAKGFDKFKLTDYYHELGEETGFQPMVIYDRLNDFILVSGGEYKIKAEGIVN